MNFESIKEYFYKLYNRCYGFVLLPLAVFISLYFALLAKKIMPPIQDEFQIQICVLVLVVIATTNLTTVHWLARKRLRVFAAQAGLGNKLDRYYEIIFLRFAAGSASSLLMAVGLVFTGSEYCALYFLMVLFWMAFQWPSSRKACRDLALKGDEYDMVLHKKDRF